MTNEAQRPAARRRRKEARPQELTAAALSLFVEKGFAATRLDEVAARAGVSKGTLYLYFDSKEALFLAVIREGILPVLDEGRRMLAEHADDPVAALRAYIRGWWSMLGDTPYGGVPKLMMSEAQNFPEVANFYLTEVIQPGRALLQEIIERGVAGGVFRPVDSKLITHILMAPMLHLALWRHSFAACCQVPDMQADDYLDEYFRLLVHGLLVHDKEPNP
ncbi:TetR/AcrR family transcriptional regulator [Nitrogeniibacter mangrovi]|uniref:TetR/AcrR family transcriptional regulator n=1 Tax=Nitrogeniibacter mangrovi TaxID=2016596 RepID=A0A6C1B1V2_9RHOO|nr:TetR/AcrR family transcriptional regulator [Nitrogeniibacter mangrovi]QID16959.1 TetR/AcrR family transcriptional regulator [Nitrogeniibacter mangrovi]